MTLKFKGNINTSGTLKGRNVPTEQYLLNYTAPAILTDIPGMVTGGSATDYGVVDDNGTSAWRMNLPGGGSLQHTIDFGSQFETSPLKTEFVARFPVSGVNLFVVDVNHGGYRARYTFGGGQIRGGLIPGLIANLPADAATVYHKYTMVQNADLATFDLLIDDIVVSNERAATAQSGNKVWLDINPTTETYMQSWKVTVV